MTIQHTRRPFFTTMNGREQIYPVALFVVIEISSLHILTISIAGTTLFRTTFGQPEDQQITMDTRKKR